MKYKLLSLLALSFLFVTGAAVAGKGGPIITGIWAGAGLAMYVDGTSAEIVSVSAELNQEGNFFHGVAVFEVTVGGVEQPTQIAQMSGHISGNAINGVMGVCLEPAPACFGVAHLQGKLSGNKLRGTVVDLSDGSTSMIILHRMPR